MARKRKLKSNKRGMSLDELLNQPNGPLQVGQGAAPWLTDPLVRGRQWLEGAKIPLTGGTLSGMDLVEGLRAGPAGPGAPALMAMARAKAPSLAKVASRAIERLATLEDRMPGITEAVKGSINGAWSTSRTAYWLKKLGVLEDEDGKK